MTTNLAISFVLQVMNKHKQDTVNDDYYQRREMEVRTGVCFDYYISLCHPSLSSVLRSQIA